MTTQKEMLLGGALILALLGLGYSLYSNYQNNSQIKSALGIESADDFAALSDVVVGRTFYGVTGTITAQSAGSITVSTEDELVTYTVSADTVVLVRGELKTNEQYQAEEDAHNAKVDELIKEPEKNRAELAMLIEPSLFEESSITLSDLEVGDRIAVSTNEKDGRDAVKILLVSHDH